MDWTDEGAEFEHSQEDLKQNMHELADELMEAQSLVVPLVAQLHVANVEVVVNEEMVGLGVHIDRIQLSPEPGSGGEQSNNVNIVLTRNPLILCAVASVFIKQASLSMGLDAAIEQTQRSVMNFKSKPGGLMPPDNAFTPEEN